MRLLLLVACCLLPGGPAVGQVASTPEFSACMDASGGVTASMLDCLGAENARQDERLNRVWGELGAGLPDAQMQALREAQRAWIAFRDLDCDAAALTAEGGSLAGVIYADCVLQATTGRTDDLVRIYQGETADAQ